MADEDKVYHPVEIQDTPLPNQVQADSFTDAGATTNTGQVSKPRTTSDNRLPTKIIAHETIGSSLNTKSKKILGDFSFTELGAIHIGNYIPGVSGDIRITPNGITARDSSGNTTIGMDGDTGDAVFKGEIQAESFVSGKVQVGNNVVIDGSGNGSITVIDDVGSSSTIIDPFGLVSTSSFQIHSIDSSPATSFTNTTYTNLTGSVDFIITRARTAIITLSVVGSSEQINNALDCSGRTYYRANSSTNGELLSFYYDSFITVATGIRENIISKTYSTVKGVSLAAGEHQIFVQSKIANDTNFRSVANEYHVTVLLLGI